MKERLINKMKKLSACKIENLYFNVGDLVVRNVWLLGNKYVNQRNMEILKELK